MNVFVRNPSLRQGQFLWRDEGGQKEYIATIKKKIADGYYFSEKVIGSIIDEMAPIINEKLDHDLG